MKIELSVASVNDAIQRVKTLRDNIMVANERIVERLVEDGGEQALFYNSSAPTYGINDTRIITEATLNGFKSKGSVALNGSNAVYYEFGTGEEGASNPHPTKDNFGLNPYNSGPFVSTHVSKAGRHYWFVPKGRYTPNTYVKNGGYTEGIPAGKQMYNTAQHLHSVKYNIIKDELNGAIRKFK